MVKRGLVSIIVWAAAFGSAVALALVAQNQSMPVAPGEDPLRAQTVPEDLAHEPSAWTLDLEPAPPPPPTGDAEPTSIGAPTGADPRPTSIRIPRVLVVGRPIESAGGREQPARGLEDMSCSDWQPLTQGPIHQRVRRCEYPSRSMVTEGRPRHLAPVSRSIL